MGRLKADFHAHCADDPCDTLAYSAESLICAAARDGVQVFSLTCHEAIVHNDYLAEFALRQGVVLVPGMEATIEGKHVLILNPSPAHASVSTFAELRRAGKGEAFFIAPHPFYPSPTALGPKLLEHLDLFDAIEYHAFYLPGLNFNRRAEALARRVSLPLIANTDTHTLPYAASSCTWIEAEPTCEGVMGALKSGAYEIETRPKPWPRFFDMVRYMVWQEWRDRTTRRRSLEVPQ